MSPILTGARKREQYFHEHKTREIQEQKNPHQQQQQQLGHHML